MYKQTKKQLGAANFKMKLLEAAIDKHNKELAKLNADKAALEEQIAALTAKYNEEVEASKVAPNAEVPTEEVNDFLNSLSV